MHPNLGLAHVSCKMVSRWRIRQEHFQRREVKHAQNEKELLAAVFACDHYDLYMFGREGVVVETDHKPLENIGQKSFHSGGPRASEFCPWASETYLGKEASEHTNATTDGEGHHATEEDHVSVLQRL